MKKHKVTRKTKSGKTITYWRGQTSPDKRKKKSGKEYRNKAECLHKIVEGLTK